MNAFLILAGIGAILGIIIAFAADFLYVAVDERLTKVTEMLPGYNCGACGCPGCAGMAEKVLANEINLKACKPGKEEELAKIQVYLSETPGPDGEVINVKM